MDVTIPKSTRSCFVMYASSSSAGRPGMARANGTNDSFFLLPEYAVDHVYVSLVIIRWATMERYILGGIGGDFPIKNKSGSAAIDIQKSRSVQVKKSISRNDEQDYRTTTHRVPGIGEISWPSAPPTGLAEPS